VVGATTKAFIEYNVESQRNLSAIDYYSEQISAVHAEIDSLMEARVKIYNKAGLNGFKVHNSAGIQQMRNLEVSYYKIRAQREGLEKRYNMIVKAIEESPEYMPNMRTGENPNLVRANAILSEGIEDLDQLRIQHPDSSRFVRRQMEYVEDLRGNFERERESFVQDLRISLESMRQEEESQYLALKSYEAGILAYPEWERQLHSLDMRIDTHQDLLESLQMKLGEVRLKGESDQRISNITALNTPTIGVTVGGSKKLIYLVLASVLGVVLGLVVALLVDAQDHRIFDRRQAEQVLEVPVLGSISPGELPAGKS